MAETGLQIAGISVTVEEWQAIQKWAKDPTYLEWRPPWAPHSKVLCLPEAWSSAVQRHNQKVWTSGENPHKRWDSFNTVHEAKRQQRLNVLGKELMQHRNRLEQARRHADLEKDLDNMLLRGALLAANPHEQDRVVAMLSQTDRVLGEGEIEETQEFQDADNSQRKRPKTTEGEFIDNAQNLRFYNQPGWDDQKQAGGQLRDGAKDLQFHSLLRCDGGGAQEAHGPPLGRS